MKKIKSTKRLNLQRETLVSLTQLREVVGGGPTPTKPNASCFIQCVPTLNCPVTQTCPLATAHC